MSNPMFCEFVVVPIEVLHFHHLHYFVTGQGISGLVVEGDSTFAADFFRLFPDNLLHSCSSSCMAILLHLLVP